MTKFVGLLNIIAASFLCLCMSVAVLGQTVTTLSVFDITNGAYPTAALIQGTDGNFYGTTLYGGIYRAGTAFRVTPSGELALYSFCHQAGCADGEAPIAALELGNNDRFYGTTTDGGSNGAYGTFFRLASDGTLSTLYSFCAQNGCKDGSDPAGAPLQGSDGNFYGTTETGGRYSNAGTVYKITPNGELTTLHMFCVNFYCTDGAEPDAALIEGLDGNFYGTTAEGGINNGYGAVFKITPTGVYTRLHSFCSKPGCTDGWEPDGGVLLATDGNFYGTTILGGANGGSYGTLYKMTPNGQLTVLHSFCASANCADGEQPDGGLIQGTDGNLYGTTSRGGTGNEGTIFQLSAHGVLTTLYSFCSQLGCSDGGIPEAGLIQGTDGNFYGTTTYGGGGAGCSGGCGTVFKINLGLAPFISLVRNSGNIGQPDGILGQGFTGTSSVSFSGTLASFTVVSDTFIKATIPAGATTGFVTVATPTGTLTSNVPFRVLP